MPMVGNQLTDFGIGGNHPPGWRSGTAAAPLDWDYGPRHDGSAMMILILGVLGREKWATRRTAPSRRSWLRQVLFRSRWGYSTSGIGLSAGPSLTGISWCSCRSSWDYSWRWVMEDITPVPLVELLSASVMAAYLVFGMAATHDYLAWNRTAGRRRPISTSDGDSRRRRSMAGWNTTTSSAAFSACEPAGSAGPVPSGPSKTSPRPYRLALEPLADHEILGYMECQPWLALGIRRVYSLRRLSAGSPGHRGARPHEVSPDLTGIVTIYGESMPTASQIRRTFVAGAVRLGCTAPARCRLGKTGRCNYVV